MNTFFSLGSIHDLKLNHRIALKGQMVVQMKCNLAHSEHYNLPTQQPDFKVRLYC